MTRDVRLCTSALRRAVDAQSRYAQFRDSLLLACQSLCDFELTHCEYDDSEGFVVGYERGLTVHVVTVSTLLSLASSSSRRLTLDDVPDYVL